MLGGPDLVGRQRQVRELELVIDALRGGRGNLVVLTGEAGVGKTRLAEEAVRSATAADAATSWVSCWNDAAAPPFWPWAQLLAQVALPEDVDRDTILARLTGDGTMRGGDPDDANPDVARFRLFDTVWSVLRRAAQHRPQLFVVDDLHWADSPSVQLLGFLAPQLHTAPLVIVATTRDGTDSETLQSALLGGLVRYGRRLIVPALTADEFPEYAAQLTDRPLNQAVVAELYRRTGGNPLYARELVQLLQQAGALEAFDTAAPTPAGIGAVLSDRRTDLLPAAANLVSVASVVGVEFRIDVLGEALGLDHDAMLELLDEAQRARLVREAGLGNWCFVHPLMREVAYSDLGVARRARRHQDVGSALERLRDRGVAVAAAELAHHFANSASAGNAAKAIDYAEAAGHHAMSALAYEEASRRFEQALSAMQLCPLDEARRMQLLLDLGDGRAAAGQLPEARAAYRSAADIARRRSWPAPLARAALGFGSGPGGFEVAAFDREHIDLLEEASEALVESSGLRAHLMARLSVALSLTPEHERRKRLSEDAVAIARASGDISALGYALASLCDVIAGPGDVERRHRAATEIVELARQNGDTRLELLGRRLRLVALLETGDLAGVDDEIEAFAAVSDAIRQPLYAWYPALWRGMRAAMEGRFDDCERWRTRAAAIGDAAHSENAVMLCVSQEVLLGCELLDPEPALRFGHDVLERWPELANMVRPMFAYAIALSGDHDQARGLLDQVRMDDYASETLGSELVPSLVMLCDAAWLIGGHACVGALYETLLPFRHEHSCDGIGDYYFGSLERPLGLLATLLGDTQSAVAHFDAAISEHRRVGASLLLARALRDAGTAMNDRDRLREAAALYERVGAERCARALDGLPARDSALARRNVVHRDGDVWALTYAGHTARLRHTKGMTDVVRLLAKPDRDFHVLDLMASDGVVSSVGGSEMLDSAARDHYKQRLVELEDELAAADLAGDRGMSERLEAERDALIAELSRAYGLGGRARRTGEPAERARSAVTQRIRAAIGRIAEELPELGDHLRRSINTGTFCSYRPEHPVTWDVDPDLTP